VLLPFRLREAIARLNPAVPVGCPRGRLKQVLDLGIAGAAVGQPPVSPAAGGGVPVQYQRDGETRGDFVRLIDWANPANEWLAVNQFSIRGRTTPAGRTSSCSSMACRWC
jgi:type I restriction enzyme R subunit